MGMVVNNIGNPQLWGDMLSVFEDYLEQKSKNLSLIIHGFKEVEDNNERLCIILLDLFNKRMKLNLHITHIDTCFRFPNYHRLGRPRQPRPVYMRFVSLGIKDLVYGNKKLLKGTNILLTEDLTKRRYELYLQVRNIVGKERVWTLNGEIFALNIAGEKILIRKEEDINWLMNCYRSCVPPIFARGSDSF